MGKSGKAKKTGKRKTPGIPKREKPTEERCTQEEGCGSFRSPQSDTGAACGPNDVTYVTTDVTIHDHPNHRDAINPGDSDSMPANDQIKETDSRSSEVAMATNFSSYGTTPEQFVTPESSPASDTNATFDCHPQPSTTSLPPQPCNVPIVTSATVACDVTSDPHSEDTLTVRAGPTRNDVISSSSNINVTGLLIPDVISPITSQVTCSRDLPEKSVVTPDTECNKGVPGVTDQPRPHPRFTLGSEALDLPDQLVSESQDHVVNPAPLPGCTGAEGGDDRDAGSDSEGDENLYTTYHTSPIITPAVDCPLHVMAGAPRDVAPATIDVTSNTCHVGQEEPNLGLMKPERPVTRGPVPPNPSLNPPRVSIRPPDTHSPFMDDDVFEDPDVAVTSRPGRDVENCGCCNVRSTCCQKVFPTGYWEEFKTTGFIALGMAFVQVCTLCIQPVTVMFGGRLGKLELDTIALSNTLINVLGNSIVNGMSTACDTLFSQTFGSPNKKLVGVQLQRALMVTFLALCLCYAIHLNLEHILILLRQDPWVAKMSARYLLLFMPGMLCLFVYVTIRKYVQCQNIVIPHMIIGGVGLAGHALSQLLFVHYLEWGLDGSAIGQAVGYFFMMLLSFLYIIFSKMYVTTWAGWSRHAFMRWGEFFWLALFGMLMFCLEWWAFEITIILAGIVGTTELGAQTVLFNINFSVPVSIPSGVGIAASIRVGQELGAGQPRKALNASRVGYSITIVTQLILAAILLSCAHLIPQIFTNVPEVVDMVSSIVPYLALVTVIDSISSIGRGICRGAGLQGLATVIIAVGYYMIAMPIGITLLFKTRLRLLGVWVGLILALAIVATIYFFFTNFLADWGKLSLIAQRRAQIKKSIASGSSPVKLTDQESISEEEEDDNQPLLAVPGTGKRRPSFALRVRRSIRRSFRRLVSGNVKVRVTFENEKETVGRDVIAKRALTTLIVLGIVTGSALIRVYVPVVNRIGVNATEVIGGHSTSLNYTDDLPHPLYFHPTFPNKTVIIPFN